MRTTLLELRGAAARLDFDGAGDLTPDPARVARLVVHRRAMAWRHDPYEALRFEGDFGTPTAAELLTAYYASQHERST